MTEQSGTFAYYTCNWKNKEIPEPTKKTTQLIKQEEVHTWFDESKPNMAKRSPREPNSLVQGELRKVESDSKGKTVGGHSAKKCASHTFSHDEG